MITLPNRPQSYGEIISTAFNFTKATFAKVFPLLFLLIITHYAMQFFGGWVEYSNKMNNLGMSFVGIVCILVLLFINYALFGGAIYRMHCLAKREDPGFSEAFFFGSKKVIPMIIVAILYTLAIALGFVLLIIPGFIVGIYLIFSLYLIYLDFGIIDSMKESYRLVKDNWWRTAINVFFLFLIIIFAALLFVGIMAILTIGLQVMVGQSVNLGEQLYYKVFVNFFAALLMLLVYNFSIAFMLNCIYDLQIRKKEPAALQKV